MSTADTATVVGDNRRRGAAGLGLAVLSAATFSTSGPFADSLMATGWTPAAVVTARVLLAAALLTAPALWTLHGRWQLLLRSLPAVIAYGAVAVAGCQLLFFNAVQHLAVGVALLLEYAGIFLVALWMWLRHSQRPRRLTVAGGIAAVLGLLLVLHPGGGPGVQPVGLLWGAAAAAGLATYYVLSAQIDDDLPPVVMAWAAMTIGALGLLAAVLTGVLPYRTSHRDVTLAGHHTNWVIPVLGLALIAAALAYAAGIGAARLLGARLASFVGLTEVLFAVLFAWALLGQVPGLAQIVGGAVVVLGIALVRLDEMSEASGEQNMNNSDTSAKPKLSSV